jgi:5S rRNA maturation endonuclease (ribonuclease M5)
LSRREQLVDLLNRSGIQATDGERNVMVCCPMAPFSGQHRKLRDSRPSMGIKHSEHGAFLVNCFTCGYRSTSLAQMYEDIAFKSQDNSFMKWVDEANKIEQLDPDGVLSLLDGIERGTEIKLKTKDQPFYDDEYSEYRGQFDHWYWRSRNIRPETCERWDCGFDTTRDRIVIPIKSSDNHVRGATGRAISELTTPKYHNYWEMKKGYWLLGESLCLGKTLIIVEGPLDALVVDQHLGDLDLRDEYSVVSLMGASFTKRQVDMMCRLANELLIFMDRDEAGRKAPDQISYSLRGRMLTSKVAYGNQTIKDPGSTTLEQFTFLLENTTFL